MPGVEGRVALVTGASQGIGRACALVFAGAGAKVALCARNQEKLQQVAAEIAAAGRRSRSRSRWTSPAKKKSRRA